MQVLMKRKSKRERERERERARAREGGGGGGGGGGEKSMEYSIDLRVDTCIGTCYRWSRNLWKVEKSGQK